MGRQQRIDPEFGIHHVYSRGTRRWVLFQDDIDRGRFLGLLDRVVDRYAVEVVCFCLMDNHFHLVLRCPQAGISHVLRDLKSMYGRWYNARHSYSGPVFEGRFGSVLVRSHRQLKQLVRYVHRNPYALDPNMQLGQFPWSSHNMYLGHQPAPEWMSVGIGRELFSDYQAEVETPIASDAVQNSPVRSTTVPDAARVAVPGTVTLGSGVPSLADVLQAVAQAAGCEVIEVRPDKRNGLIGVAVRLAKECLGYSVSEIAEPFGYRSGQAVSMAAARARKRHATDDGLAAVLATATAELMPKAA